MDTGTTVSPRLHGGSVIKVPATQAQGPKFDPHLRAGRGGGGLYFQCWEVEAGGSRVIFNCPEMIQPQPELQETVFKSKKGKTKADVHISAGLGPSCSGD